MSICVLLSTYNGEKFLAEQLNSIAQQSYQPLHLLIRDDGSQDKTLSHLYQFKEQNKTLASIRIIEGKNIGATDSFFSLLHHAPMDVDYWAFADQDDVWLPEKLESAIDQLQSIDTKPAVYCSRQICVDQKLKFQRLSPIYLKRGFETVLFQNFMTGCTMVFNPKAMELITDRIPDDGAILHDWWIALVITAFGTAIFDQRAFIKYRQHPSNVVGLAKSDWRQYLLDFRRLVKRRRAFYKGRRQAEAFLNIYGDMLKQEHYSLVKDFVSSNRTFLSRLRYSITGPISSNQKLRELALRLLILLGWYT